MKGGIGETVPAPEKPRPTVSGKPLDCIGIDPARSGVGKHAFIPSDQPIVHGIGNPAEAEKLKPPEPIDRYCTEKITELAMLQQELTRDTRERNALAHALGRIATGDLPDGSPAEPNAQKFAVAILAKLASGELRKHGV